MLTNFPKLIPNYNLKKIEISIFPRSVKRFKIRKIIALSASSYPKIWSTDIKFKTFPTGATQYMDCYIALDLNTPADDFTSG